MGISRWALRPTLIAAAAVVLLGVAGCAPAAPHAANPGAEAGFEAPAGGQGTDARAALEKVGLSPDDPAALAEGLDALPVADRSAALTATVTPGEIIVQPDQPGELAIPLPEDQFYASIAPYRVQTHPCTNHVPTSCLGELRDEAAQLRVTDEATGEVVIEREVRTADNGFVGVWLPRDGAFLVEMTVAGDTGAQVVRTGADDPTCITTLQLAAA